MSRSYKVRSWGFFNKEEFTNPQYSYGAGGWHGSDYVTNAKGFWCCI